MTMHKTKPLTPTLSPRRGEREEIPTPPSKSLNGEVIGGREGGFPLPIRWGEGQGEGPFPFYRHG